MIPLRPLTWFLPLEAAGWPTVSGAAAAGGPSTSPLPPPPLERRSPPLPASRRRQAQQGQAQGCVNPHPFLALVHVGGWVPSAGYMETYRELTGRPILHDQRHGSLVTHNALIYKPYMEAFLRNITSAAHRATAANESRPGLGLGWALSIMDAVAKLKSARDVNVGFSEFWSYLSWVKENHPCTVVLASQQEWSRAPARPPSTLPVSVLHYFSPSPTQQQQQLKEAHVRICCPTGADLEERRRAAGGGLLFSGYELGHVAGCNYHHPAFADGYAEWFAPP
ncbi:hypothetical protein GPECTOR_681g819 [Gonium pectorale]|uniref:Uncharacterized protein n=1 Tax=Gonium pectorale TaxID=33097 RepID=A0A150FUA2_GONPE|nr:hypothetical protein GPECTOR_681g819 [Gonium pectorale]|eukprot:KXZ41179.1 hypothetical protein GPECTOR_681g819 [Gonium pectorale]